MLEPTLFWNSRSWITRSHGYANAAWAKTKFINRKFIISRVVRVYLDPQSPFMFIGLTRNLFETFTRFYGVIEGQGTLTAIHTGLQATTSSEPEHLTLLSRPLDQHPQVGLRRTNTPKSNPKVVGLAQVHSMSRRSSMPVPRWCKSTAVDPINLHPVGFVSISSNVYSNHPEWNFKPT